MNKIVHVSLTDLTVKEVEYDIKQPDIAGRALIVDLLSAHRGNPDVIVLAPGLLTGTPVPCTGRLAMGAAKQGGMGYTLGNTAGPFAQKLASLNIAALVITGSPETQGELSAIHITSAGVEVVKAQELRGMTVGQTVDRLRQARGKDIAVVGVGPAGEQMLPLSGVFSTYPAQGTPAFHVSRTKIGYAFGALGLKAVTVDSGGHFDSHVADAETLTLLSKQMGKLIVEHPVCGKAMPAYGSITLLHMLKMGKDYSVALTDKTSARKVSPGLNRNCAPGCVIGCLNRHAADDNEVYSSPSESEVLAACKIEMGIDDPAFARSLNASCFELGLDSLEYLRAAVLFLKAQNLCPDRQLVTELLQEFSPLTLKGRVIGQGVMGVAELYPGNAGGTSSHSSSLRPVNGVKLPEKAKGCEMLDDRTYLHGFMIGAENLGMCLFTAFALIEDPQGLPILAAMASAKMGSKVEPGDIITSGLETIRKLEGLEHGALLAAAEVKMPEFVKVLYRYFE